MAESQSRLEQYRKELDQICAGVMPDSWTGHGRLMIAERGFESPEKREFAHRLLERLADKYPDHDSERLAEKAVDMTEKKLDGE